MTVAGLVRMHSLDKPLAQFRSALTAGGLHAALGYLNARTSYRYSGIYRLDGQTLRCMALYDRQGENPDFLAEVPLGESFCQFVLREQRFETQDSAQDRRLDGHPHQGVMRSYFGLPLSRQPGTIYGTLCHFDLAPMVIADSEIALLEAVSPLLLLHLP